MSRMVQKQSLLVVVGILVCAAICQGEKRCILKDAVNFREFDFGEYSPKLTEAGNERVLINLCQGGIPLPDLKAMCTFPDDSPHQNIFFAYLLDPRQKKCRLYSNSDIDDTIFDRKSNSLSVLISESHPEGVEKSSEDFLAFKIVLYEPTDASKDPEHKYLKLLNRDASDQYDRIIFQISNVRENLEKKIRVQNFSFGSVDFKILGITFPRLVIISILALGYFWLHLDMRDDSYPLQHILFALNNMFVYLMIQGLAKIHSMAWSIFGLLGFVGLGFLLSLALKIDWLYRITLISNVLILYELYIETIDYFDSYSQFLTFLCLELAVLFVIGYCIQLRSYKNLDNDKLKRRKLSKMKRELFIGALITIKLFVYIARAGYPMRDPLFVVQLTDARKPMSTLRRVFYIFLSMGFVIIVFVVRTFLIISAKRKYDLKILEKYGGDYFQSSFQEFAEVQGKEHQNEVQNTAIDLDLELEDDETFLKIKKRKQTLEATKKRKTNASDGLPDSNSLLSSNNSVMQKNTSAGQKWRRQTATDKRQKRGTGALDDDFVRQSEEFDMESGGIHPGYDQSDTDQVY